MNIFKKKQNPFILVIVDGWGLSNEKKGNAVYLANTPTMDGLSRKYPYTQLHASGKHVGLPSDQPGNSEAGHMNIGAGRLIEQDVVKINKSIKDGTFYKNSAFVEAIRHVAKKQSNLHLVGMLSNGQSPHSDPSHLSALIKLANEYGLKNVYFHLFTDGRDSPKYSSHSLIEELEKELPETFRIATIMGRFYAMDRKKMWARTEKAYLALVSGVGRKAKNAKSCITESYNRGESDEYIEPCIIESELKSSSRIKDNDSVIFFNLRSDRSRQLAKVIAQSDFTKRNPGSFKRKIFLNNLHFTAMTDFGPDLESILTAFPSMDIKYTMPVVLSHLSQLYIAETEKYAHVTYFFNGGYKGSVAGEAQLMISSPEVKSYDETPEMKTKEITDIIIKNLNQGSKTKNPKFEFTVVNLAAPDMIGHTGNLAAAVKCCEVVDKSLARIVKNYLSLNGTVVITADHGNIEKMINLETEEIFTEHTSSLVPFMIISKNKYKNKIKLRDKGSLCDVAPTVIDLLQTSQPKEMTGKSLILKKL